MQLVCSDLDRAQQNERWCCSSTHFWLALLVHIQCGTKWCSTQVCLCSATHLVITFHIAFALLVSVTQLQHRMFVLEVCLLSFFFLEQLSKLQRFVCNYYLFSSIFVAAPNSVFFVNIIKLTFFCYPVVNENIQKYWTQVSVQFLFI